MKKGNFIPKTSIDEFREMDPVLFELINSEYERNFFVFKKINILDFFNHFYEQLEIIELNIDNYISLTNHLFKLQLYEKKLTNAFICLLFAESLVGTSYSKRKFDLKELVFEEDTPFFYSYFCLKLDEKKEKLLSIAPPIKPNPDKFFFKFYELEHELKYFQENKINKIQYLITVKTNFLQKFSIIKEIIHIPFIDNDFDVKCDLEIKKLKELIELENIQNIEETKPQKSKEKPGRKSPVPKPLKEYFINLQKDRIPVFIEALKKDFINSSPQEFVYMINALVGLKNLCFVTRKEIFDAFEKEFDKKIGSTEAKNKQFREMNFGTKNELLERIKNKITHIKQSCLIV